MYELRVVATKVVGTCTADPPVVPGDYFTVRDGDIRIPEGGSVCLWALQSVLPLITPKEREIAEAKDQDWMWRVHSAQCPDPAGRVIYRIERVRKLDKGAQEGEKGPLPPRSESVRRGGSEGGLKALRVVVEEVGGKCTSGMRPGDYFVLRSGRLTIPAGRHFCLYALHAALPLLPAKQRPLAEGDWMKEDCHVICPDPAGNVVMRIEELKPEATGGV
jgi:uncharacterized repeat protein (TIGR04076 family)